MIDVSTQVRSADLKDQQQIANLMFFETHVHRHLDWCTPLEWLGSPFFWVIENNGKIIAALSCPKDPPRIAWVRLFVHTGLLSLEVAWETLWEKAKYYIGQQESATVAAIALPTWFRTLLLQSGFQNHQQIVTMEWNGQTAQKCSHPKDLNIRPMTPDDIPGVAEVDGAAFNPLWRNSIASIKRAYPQALIATVAETEGCLIGYQISTPNPFGAHLARLAVVQEAQHHGLGTALVCDLINQLIQRNILHLTVNTQDDNYSSLALYQKIGFVRTEEQYPVFVYEVTSKK